jgi:hypothetical protein
MQKAAAIALLEFVQTTGLMHPKQTARISIAGGMDVWRQERE